MTSASNPRLRTAVDKAKSVNMPADNIKRAIQKGTGELEGAMYEEITLEGYGPGGIALLVEGTTDNRNRTVSEIRHTLTKNGGNLGTAGSVSYMFKPRGYIAIAKEKVDGREAHGPGPGGGGGRHPRRRRDLGGLLARPTPTRPCWPRSRRPGSSPRSRRSASTPRTSSPSKGTKAQQMLKLVEALEDNDDVQNVWANFDVSEKEMEAAAAS